jgi:hypothetical protein
MTSPNHQMIECPHEADVLDALASARWPERVETGLTQHVASCSICQDVVSVASVMQEDHEAARHEWNDANVPSSGQMWWRAEMRARQDAIREATRPVTVAQAVAAGLAVSVAGVAGWLAWPTVQGFFAALVPGSTSQASVFSSPLFLPVAVAMLGIIVIAPVALYFVLTDN